MKLRTAIVEDQKPDAERLEQLLKKAFENENISCSCFASGDEFLRADWREGYQVVFLDICMEGTNGIETARRLRAADPDLLIVFVTSSPEYVWDAFPVHPFDYLLKPYKEEKFEQLAGELRRVLCRQQPELEVRIARQTVPYGVALAPAQILFSLSSGICLSFVGNASGENAQGLFAFGYSLAQLVTAIQAGFSTYWGPYVYSHYRDEQERICRVHDVLNLLIFGFFCVLVMFEDIVFVIFPDKRGCLAIFPLLMLAVVFNILCEGTVYGNSIARKPWHDTIGIGLGALSNLGLCAWLVPAFGLTGAALALAASNGLAFLYRSVTGQMYYRTVASYSKTISGFLLAFAVTAIGTLLWQHFFIKFALVGVILFIYCTLYRAQLARLWSMGLGILRGIFHRK